MRSSVNASYPDLLSVEEPIDMVDIFRPPAAGRWDRGAGDCQASKINLDATPHCQSRRRQARRRSWPMDVIVDRCVKMEHGRYNGSLHWVGMNTEIVTAKKARRFF